MSDETEETINRHLEDLGLLEDGMTANDKLNLWKVIKISKDTAQAEEQDRQKRARRNLQIDEVSSRSEMNDDDDDDIKEVEEVTITKVKSQERKSSRDSPHGKIALAVSSEQSPTSTSVSSSSRTRSPNHQSVAFESYNRVEVTPRRALRSLTNTSQSRTQPVTSQSHEVDQERSPVSEGSSTLFSSQNLQSTINIKSPLSLSPLSPHSIENVPSPGQLQNPPSPRSLNSVLPSTNIKNLPSPRNRSTSSPRNDQECHSQDNEKKESSPKNWSDVVRGNSEADVPSPEPVMELTCDDSPILSDHESSPVRRIRKDFSLSLKFQSTDENIKESSALNDNEKEKCDIVPSPTSESSLNLRQNSNGIRKEAEDREKNIDAFNCDRKNYDLTLKVRKPRRVSRLPFYIPPNKMDVHSYIAYFKKCVSEHHRKLLEVQKKSHKCVPWGDPVVVGETDTKEITEQKKDSSSQQRYNFRSRRLAQQNVGAIYEDSNSQNDTKTHDDADDLFDSLLEEEKPADDIQIIRKEELSEHSKPNTTPDRQGSKRKSESGDDMEEKRPACGEWLTTVKSEEEEVAVKRKKLGTVCYAGAANSWKDIGLDFIQEEEPPKKLVQQNGQNKSRKRRNRRKLHKRLSTAKEEDTAAAAAAAAATNDEPSIFTDLSEVESAGSSRSHQESDIIIRPAPVKLRKQGRQRVAQTRQEQKDTDVAVIFDATSSRNKELEIEVPCPICRVAYPAKDIEAHASECNEYCVEEIPEDEEENPSPQGPSQESWTQYDGVQESSSQGTAASKHSYGAT